MTQHSVDIGGHHAKTAEVHTHNMSHVFSLCSGENENTDY